MSPRLPLRLLLLIAGLAVAAGCAPETPTQPWPPITDPVVFDDTFGSRVGFQAFGNSKLDALAIDSTEKYVGRASLRFTVPAPGDPTGGYAGGAFVTTRARDLSGYNALSFYVKASRPVNLEVAGFGNDNTGTSLYTAQRTAIPITTSWTQVLVPIPLPEKLTAEEGLFFLAEGPQSGAGLTLWVDDVRFVNVSTVTNPRPILTSGVLNALVGSTVSFNGSTRTTFNIKGADSPVYHLPGYFTFHSSNTAVAIPEGGGLRVVGTGSATVTATLGAKAASGTITLNGTVPPMVAAPTPTVPSADVISLFSDAYANVPVNTWSPDWDAADSATVRIEGNLTRVYTRMLWAAIEFPPIDASAMTHFHMDVWVPVGTTFNIKLVDFGDDGVYGNDDSEAEVAFDGTTTPAFVTGQWVSFDVPMGDFFSLTGRAHLAQLILSGDARTVYVDNVYFHR